MSYNESLNPNSNYPLMSQSQWDNKEKLKELSEEGELWRPCPDFETKYLVSSHGRVMSIGSYNTCKKWQFLKLYKKKGRNGYMQARFYDNGRAKTIEIHSLVAKAFIPNPNNFPMVNHIDEDKTNNHVENLEWCTNQYNIRYSHSKPVDVYTKDGEFIETLGAIADASEKYNIPTSNISRCCLSTNGFTKGYQFRFHGNSFTPKPPLTPRTTKRKKHCGVRPKEAYYISIDEYDTNGTYITTWPKVSAASKEYNIPTTNISKCCKGIINTINGHIFLKHGDSISERLCIMSNRKHKSKTESKYA